MSFEIRDSRGRRLNSFQDMFKQIEREVIDAGVNQVATDFNTFVKDKTASLQCPVHAQPLNSVSTQYRDGQLKTAFDGCCDELGKLAESTVAAALERNEFSNT